MQKSMQIWGDHYKHEAIGELNGPGLIVKMSYHLSFPQDPLPMCRDRFCNRCSLTI